MGFVEMFGSQFLEMVGCLGGSGPAIIVLLDSEPEEKI
jgi:hypothetical protein